MGKGGEGLRGKGPRKERYGKGREAKERGEGKRNRRERGRSNPRAKILATTLITIETAITYSVNFSFVVQFSV